MVRGRTRLVIWLLLVVILLMTLMTLWRPVEQRASDTALVVASKRILDRANYYKQEWLLKKQPKRLYLQGKSLQEQTLQEKESQEQVVAFSESGWPITIDDQANIDCVAWLKLLYPEERILEYVPVQINNVSKSDYYLCEYSYTQSVILLMSLKHNRFSVSVGFSSN